MNSFITYELMTQHVKDLYREANNDRNVVEAKKGRFGWFKRQPNYYLNEKSVTSTTQWIDAGNNSRLRSV